MADHFVARLKDPRAPAAERLMALRMVPATHPKLTADLLAGLLNQDDTSTRLEAVRALREHPSAKRFAPLLATARDEKSPEAMRAEAVVGLAERSAEHRDELLRLAAAGSPVLRQEALRSLAQTPLAGREKEVEEIGRRPGAADLAARVLGRPFHKDRPAAGDIDAWLKRLDGPASASAGRRVFFHPKLATCSRCHRVEGRGQDVGPDLSAIGRTERRHILESILQPDNLVAPHYQAWVLATHDGKTRTGMLMHTHLDEYTYVDAKGERFKLNTRDIAESAPAKNSIMPTGLVDLLTDQELRDLLAFLCRCR